MTLAAFIDGPWKDAAGVVDALDFYPRGARSWVMHRPPTERLALPIAIFRNCSTELNDCLINIVILFHKCIQGCREGSGYSGNAVDILPRQ